MIQELNPEHLLIFKEELRRTHGLLFYALSQPAPKMSAYISQFRNSLSIDKTHIIQFSILAYLRPGIPFETYLREFQTPVIKFRAREICDLVQKRLSFVSKLGNLLFRTYPQFHKDELASELQVIIQFANNDELKCYVLQICGAVLWFDAFAGAVASILAFLVRTLCFSFPLDQFIDLLIENIDRINKFVLLFWELQYFGQFSYADFLQHVIKRGLFFSHREETVKLVLALPCASRQSRVLSRLDGVLERYVPGNTFNDDLRVIGVDIPGHIEIAQRLPTVLKYQLAAWVIEQPLDMAVRSRLLLELDTPNLIVDFFRTWTVHKIPLILVPTICETIPVFMTHNCFPEFLRFVVEAPITIPRAEVLGYLHEHFRGFPPLQFFKQQIAEAVKIVKTVSIGRNAIREIARQHSYLFGLHTLDAFLDIKTPADLNSVFPLFLLELFRFEGLTVDAFFTFFVEFSESKCVTRACHFFTKTMIGVLLTHPVLLETPRCLVFFSEFFHRGFVSQLLTTEQYLRCLLMSKKRQKAKTPEHQRVITMLLKLFSDIIQSDLSRWSVNAILTDVIVKGFNQSFPTDPTPFTDFLVLLRRLEPPVITRDMILKHIDPNANCGSAYLAALFSLLPDSLHSPDFVDVFDFFKANVDRKTISFWTLWLKMRPYYLPGFPVTVTAPDREALSGYRGLLISAFSSLLFRARPGDDRTMTHFQCWSMICENPGIAGCIADNIMEDLRMMRLSLYPLLIDFLHPALVTVPDRVFEAITEGFCCYHFDETQFEVFAKLSASIFVVYVSRFPTDEFRIPIIADKLLEWIPKLYEMHSTSLEAVVDIFNFVICFTASDRDEDPLQDSLHERIKDRFKSIPEDIQNLIILNRPRQVFRTVKDPLYLDYTGPDRDSGHGFTLGPSFSPDRSDATGFSGPFDNSSLFNTFEEDFNPTWYWGQ
jgi:hypothetical protein